MEKISLSTQPILRVIDLKKWFPMRTGLLAMFEEKRYVMAVNGVSFDVKTGETLCIAGESGSGKTTLARTILRLIEPTDGEAFFEDRNIFNLDREDLRNLRTEIQIIFQNPFEILDPRLTVEQLVGEPLVVHELFKDEKELREMVLKALEDVRLIPPEDFARRYPHELSGGQLQRVAIARSLILQPRLMFADEPVSMLDASIRTEILNLMEELQEKYNLTYIFITHDLAQARYIGDHLIVLYLGRVMEEGPMEEVIGDPIHPYTMALISNVPVPDPTVQRDRIDIKGETPTPIDLPPGCGFHPRCPEAADRCDTIEPELKEVKPGRFVRCHYR